MPFVYILKCADGVFYVGRTDDLEQRLQAHQRGEGSRFTSCRRPVEMVYAEEHQTQRGAVAREQQLKRWTRAKKEALIAGNRAALKAL